MAVTADGRCDHKFVDSKRCLKCGWVPAVPEVQSIEVARLKPGDVVVITLDDRFICKETVARIEEYVQPLFPNNKILVIEHATLKVVRS